MCGIVGVFSRQGVEVITPTLNKMRGAIAHRGPDDMGDWIQWGIGLAHQRLSIIDVTSNGHQPMLSNDEKVVLVFNGEIYNYLELREQLTSLYSFQTASDSEVILAAYVIWGEQFVSKLNGMFAFALYDRRSDELLLYRDRLGEKPLYYYHTNETYLFSSEIRALLASDQIPRVLDSFALREYVSTQTVSYPRTIIKSVSAVMPGCYLKITRSDFQEIRYWDFNKEGEILDNEREIQSKIKSELYRSVEWRMRADVSFGAFLSGGLDSSVLVGIMAEVAEQPVHTFSIGFEEEEWDESAIAHQVAKRFGTRHTQVVLNGNHFLNEVEAAIHSMDHPSGDGVNTFVVSKITHQHGIKMAMSGLGGDELFGGYPIFKRMKESKAFRNFFTLPPLPYSWMERLLSMKWNGVQVERISHLLRSRDLSDQAMLNADRLVNGTSSMSMLFSDPSTTVQDRIWKDWGEHHLFSSLSQAEMTTYMTHVLLRDSDQMSMANALEIRVPFLDHSLVESVLAIPDSFKMGAHPKQLLIDMFKDLLPAEVYERKKKGFAFPWQKWMLKEINTYCALGLLELTQRTAINDLVVQDWWRQFNQGKSSVPWNKLWHLVVLGHWMKNNDIHGQ